MRTHCPNCHHPIPLGETADVDRLSDVLQTISSVRCPNCGEVPIDWTYGPQSTWDLNCVTSQRMQVAHFRLVRLLGQGAYGTVWLADDINLDRQVALKLPVVRSGRAANLLHEAQSAAHLRHPNIVAIYEVGIEEDQAFIASDYIRGMSLRDFLSIGKPQLDRAIAIVIPIAEALHHAHVHGVIHRDVKPANILLNDAGEPFITDFGLAKRISAQSSISSDGQVLGTARYMSPEQASGKTAETDHRTDIYALGVILYEMLTGHLPYRGNVRALLQQKVVEDAPSPRTLDPTLPKDLETICLKCLERDPRRRYQSALEVAQELRRFRAREPVHARPITRVERAWRWCQRRPAVAGLLAGLILSLMIGLSGVSFFWWQAERNANLTRRSLYRSQMNLAAQFLERGDTLGLRQTLAPFERDEKLRGLRDFAWHYFDLQTEPFLQIVNHGRRVGDVAVSSDGAMFASTGDDRTIRLWDGRTGQAAGTLVAQRGKFQSIAFSPTRLHLAAGASDGVVRIWDAMNGTPPVKQWKHGPPVTMVRYSPDGERLLSAGESGAVRIWNVAEESPVAEIPTGHAGTKNARFSNDGRLVAIAADDQRVHVWEVDGRNRRLTLAPAPVTEVVAFSPDDRTIFTGGYDGRIRAWSTDDGTQQDADELFWRIGDFEFLKDSPLAVILTSEGLMQLYDTQRLQELRRLKTHYLTFGTLARSADGTRLVIGSGDGSVKLLDVESLQQPEVLWHPDAVRSAAFVEDNRLLTATQQGVWLWDLEIGESQQLAAADGAERILIAAHPAGRKVAVAAGKRVELRSVATGKELASRRIGGADIADMAFSESGNALAIAARSGAVVVTGETLDGTRLDVPSRESPVGDLIFIGDDVLVAAYADGAVHCHAIDRHGDVTASFEVPGEPSVLAVCDSGRMLAVGTSTGDMHVWDVATRQSLRSMTAHTSEINALAAIPNSPTLLSAGRDRAIKVWDLSSGEPISWLSGHERQVFCLAVSKDGSLLVSGGLDGDLRLWRAR